MTGGQSSKLIRIHCSERDRWQGKPLFEAIVEKCMELKIAGATVFRSLEGFGDTAEMYRPVVVEIVDSAENAARLMAGIEPMIGAGLVSVADVRAIRVSR